MLFVFCGGGNGWYLKRCNLCNWFMQKFSVVIICRNEADVIAPTLRSMH